MHSDGDSVQEPHQVNDGLAFGDNSQPVAPRTSGVGRRVSRKRATPGESIHLKRFIRRLGTDNVFAALMFDSDRDDHADFLVWELACEVYSADQLAAIFEELVASGGYSMGRLVEELESSYDGLRDPSADIHFPSVAAASAAVKREAKARLVVGDYHWAILDPMTGRSPERNGCGWANMTDELLERMISDRNSKAIDMRFARDLGL